MSRWSQVRRSARNQRVAWVVLAVAVAVALVVGAHRPTPPRRSAEIAAIEADTKCPSCEDLSVATSTAPTAIAARAAIVKRIDAGQSPKQVEDYLVSRYGQGILLRPPTSGLTGLVWELPLLAAGLAAVALGVFFWRRRRVTAVAVSEEDDELVRRLLEEDDELVRRLLEEDSQAGGARSAAGAGGPDRGPVTAGRKADR